MTDFPILAKLVPAECAILAGVTTAVVECPLDLVRHLFSSFLFCFQGQGWEGVMVWTEKVQDSINHLPQCKTLEFFSVNSVEGNKCSVHRGWKAEAFSKLVLSKLRACRVCLMVWRSACVTANVCPRVSRWSFEWEINSYGIWLLENSPATDMPFTTVKLFWRNTDRGHCTVLSGSVFRQFLFAQKEELCFNERGKEMRRKLPNFVVFQRCVWACMRMSVFVCLCTYAKLPANLVVMDSCILVLCIMDTTLLDSITVGKLKTSFSHATPFFPRAFLFSFLISVFFFTFCRFFSGHSHP